MMRPGGVSNGSRLPDTPRASPAPAADTVPATPAAPRDLPPRGAIPPFFHLIIITFVLLFF